MPFFRVTKTHRERNRNRSIKQKRQKRKSQIGDRKGRTRERKKEVQDGCRTQVLRLLGTNPGLFTNPPVVDRIREPIDKCSWYARVVDTRFVQGA